MITFTTGTATRVSVEDCRFNIVTDELEIDQVPKSTQWGYSIRELVLVCGCCKGTGEHPHGRGPNLDTYLCEPCRGFGHFRVTTGDGEPVTE
jgi:hypothetical protein